MVMETPDHVKYICWGKEVGEEGTPHLQGYLVFEYANRISACKKILPRAHWEKRLGNHEQAKAYCMKDGDFHEFGIEPVSQKRKGELGAEWYRDQIKKVADKNFEDVDPHYLVTNYSGLLKAASLLYPAKLEDTEEKMEWYYGPSGTGKSKKARTENPDAYLKMCNKWWDGYTDQECVLIEDFDRDHKVLAHHLKIWGDRYPFPAEIKGGKIDIRPKKIIVTSNYHPKDIWENEADLEPILRRFKVTNFKHLNT